MGLKVAIIGAGAIAHSHVQAYLQFPERCQIIAVCDLYPEKAEAMVKSYHLDAVVTADYQSLFQMGIDVFSICTPPFEHATMAIHCLQAGSHVLIEKPMAASLEECDAINDAAIKANKLVSVVAQNRYRNPLMKLKSVIDSGLTGKIVHAQVDSHWWRGHSYYDLWWRGTWEKESGGPTLNHAVHHIDALLWMRGQPVEVQAIMSNVAHDNAEVEDISIALLRYADGTLGQITSSVVHHGEEQQIIFQGLDARVSAPWKVTASTALANGFPEQNKQLEEQIASYYLALPDLQYEGHTGQIDNLLTAILSEEQLLIDGVSGRATLELITAIYKSAATKQAVQLPLDPSDDFYTRAGLLEHTIYFYEKTGHVENFAHMEITTGSSLEEKQ